MKILKKKRLWSGFDGFEWRIKVRMTSHEAKNPEGTLRKEFYVHPCGHSHDCCGCLCSSYPKDIVLVGARRVKATISFYYNV